MTAFNLHDPRDAYRVSPDAKREAWAWSIAQCRTAEQCLALQLRLYRRLEMLRHREASCEVEREALIACANRSVELIRKRIASPVAPGRHDEAQRRRPFAGMDFGV